MRIAHLCLSNWFVDGVGYQENELVRQHIADGHDVLVIASTETHSDEGKLTYTNPADYIGVEGARVIRITYRKFMPEVVMRKLRMHIGLRDLLNTFRPEVILFHGTCGWELLTTASYVKANPSVSLYVDSHEDRYNSARNWLSRELLHRQYYGRILRFVLPRIKKVLCYSPESIDFVESTYFIHRKKLELYPLGGRPIPDDEYASRRDATRATRGIADDQVLIVQAGKQTSRKKILDSLTAISSNENNKLRFLVAGNIDSSILDEVTTGINSDDRIHFLGWKSFDELTDLLCAADIYLQPGTQSVTMQHSLCCRCTVILDDVPSHQMYVKQNGWLIGRDGTLSEIISNIKNVDLDVMKLASFRFAQEHLDYALLAKRIFREE